MKALLLLYYVHVSFADNLTTTTEEDPHAGIGWTADDIKTEPTAESTTVTTLETTTEEPPVYTEFDFNKHFNVTGDDMSEQELEDLTAQAFASIAKRDEGEKDEEEQVYDPVKQNIEDKNMRVLIESERIRGIKHVEHYDQIIRNCYSIGINYKNAMTDIKKYSPLRYLYVNNLRYEVGYLVEEIIVHYQIVVEIYHLMVRKYGLNRYRFYAPTTYMLYIYTNILNECKTIIHLCNMLHELEAKYEDHPDTIFEDYHLQRKPPSSNKHRNKDLSEIDIVNQRLIREKKKRMKAQKKARKKLFKTGFYETTSRQREPKKGPFPLHYGWSIEDW